MQDNNTIVVTVELSKSTRKRLTTRKDPGDSFEDVVKGLLDSAEQTHENSGQTHDEATQ